MRCYVEEAKSTFRAPIELQKGAPHVGGFKPMALVTEATGLTDPSSHTSGYIHHSLSRENFQG